MDEIEKIAYKYDLKVIYDAAHAFGERYDGKGVGEYGDISTFSFHATKVYNTIEGGAVCCHTKEQYERLYNLKNFGIRSEEMVVSVGANAKMNEFQAAMGLCNLNHLEYEIAKRKKIVEMYLDKFGKEEYIRLNYPKENVKTNYAYFPVLFGNKEERDRVYQALAQENIYSRKYFYPITADQVCFKNKFKKMNLEKARYCADRILVLPLYADLEEKDVDRIVKIVKKAGK